MIFDHQKWSFHLQVFDATLGPALWEIQPGPWEAHDATPRHVPWLDGLGFEKFWIPQGSKPMKNPWKTHVKRYKTTIGMIKTWSFRGGTWLNSKLDKFGTSQLFGRPGRNQPFPSAAINGPLGTLSWHFEGRRLSEYEWIHWIHLHTL